MAICLILEIPAMISWCPVSSASFIVLCCGLHREIRRPVPQPFPGGVSALHVRSSFATTAQLRGRLAPVGGDGCQPRPCSAQPQPGAAVRPQQPTADADGDSSEHAGWPAVLARASAAGGQWRPGEVPATDSATHSFYNGRQQRRQRELAATPHSPSVRWVVKSREAGRKKLNVSHRARCYKKAADGLIILSVMVKSVYQLAWVK